MRAAGAEALVIVPTPELYRDSEQLAAFADVSRLPTIGGFREGAEKGLLIGYGPKPQRTWRTSSRLCRAHFEWSTTGRVTVSRPNAFRLRDQHEDRQSTWPHDPAVPSCWRGRGDRLRRREFSVHKARMDDGRSRR